MRKGCKARILMVCVFAALFWVGMTVLALAAKWPSADGSAVKTNGGLTVDASNASEGYIMAKGPKTDKRLKLRVKFEETTLDYDLDGRGQFVTIPLQMGSGKYTFTLYKNVSGKKYAQEGKIAFSAKLSDPDGAFLYPNMYVDYDKKTEAVKKSEELCKGLTTDKERYDAIFKFITTEFVYDYVKMVTVKAGMLPDIDSCYEKRMGICQDLSAVAVCMLRVQGIPARLMIGNLSNGTYHAWVMVEVDGKDILFDPTAELSAVAKDQEYTIERYY